VREEFLRLLHESPTFRDEVRRILLTEELLDLPARTERLRAEMHEELTRIWQAIGAQTERMERVEVQIASLTERMERVEVQIASLTERMERVEAQIASLTERMERVEVQIASLTERMERVEVQIASLTERIDTLTRQIGHFQRQWGLETEEIAHDLMRRFLEAKGWAILRGGPLQYDGEVDLVFAVRTNDRTFTIAVEVKGRIWSQTPMDDLLTKIRRPDFASALRRGAYPEPVRPAVFGFILYTGAREAAEQAGVGLFSPYGEVVPVFPP
jgi:archaellum component FlaC